MVTIEGCDRRFVLQRERLDFTKQDSNHNRLQEEPKERRFQSGRKV